jgi:23S rRNA pseudouridine2457 synthase
MPHIAFYKPYGTVSQFTPEAGHRPLAAFGLPRGVYPAGRLDADSEGLLILTSDGRFQHLVADPSHGKEKTYWAQVDRVITEEALAKLRAGVTLGDGPTRPCRARLIEDPGLPPRVPPVRFRKTVPTSWAELIITEGRNRQVRRMLAHVGFPVLRLVRRAVGAVTLEGLEPGRWRELTQEEVRSFSK